MQQCRHKETTRKSLLRMLPVFLVAVIALVLATQEARAGTEVFPFSVAKLFFERNATDEDVGIQFCLDGEGWQNAEIVSPDGRKIFEVRGKWVLRGLGLTEQCVESEEPSHADLPLEEFLALFPEGEYGFIGRTVEGDRLVGTATLTHVIPDAPVIITPGEGEEVDPDNTVIMWNLVPDPPGSAIVGYQVIVEREDPLRVFSVDLPPSATSVTVPSELLEPGTEYKVEVLAIETTSGNKTITEHSFVTATP